MANGFSIKYMADLAALVLDREEMDSLSEDMKEIIELMDSIRDIDTDEYIITEHISEITNVMRSDVPSEPMDNPDIMVNSAKTEDGCFVVPKLME